jgi:hypothetical protein
MAYTIRDYVGAQPIADTSTTQLHPINTRVTGWDPTYGEGIFIYLIGVLNTVVGNLVTFNALTGQTTLAPNTANLAQPVAVAMSANGAAAYGWYQIKGAAVIKKTGVVITPDVKIYLSGTAGRVRPSAASGKNILGARTANAATIVTTTSTVVVTIEYPHAQGAVA